MFSSDLPILTTILLSWILYRKTGTWAPVEVFSKAEYDAIGVGQVGGQTYHQAHRGVAFEESIDLMEARKFGGQVSYPKGGVGSTFENPITM